MQVNQRVASASAVLLFVLVSPRDADEAILTITGNVTPAMGVPLTLPEIEVPRTARIVATTLRQDGTTQPRSALHDSRSVRQIHGVEIK